MAVKGKCPICLREITLCDDRSLRQHNKRKRVPKGWEPEPCHGSGQQPLDQFRLAIPAPGCVD